MTYCRTVIATVLVSLMFAGQFLFLVWLYTFAKRLCGWCTQEHYLAQFAFLIALLSGLMRTNKSFMEKRYSAQIILPVLIGCLCGSMILVNENMLSLLLALVAAGILIMPFLYSWAFWLSNGFSSTGKLVLFFMILLSTTWTVVAQQVCADAGQGKLPLLLSALALLLVPIGILLLPSRQRRGISKR